MKNKIKDWLFVLSFVLFACAMIYTGDVLGCLTMKTFSTSCDWLHAFGV